MSTASPEQRFPTAAVLVPVALTAVAVLAFLMLRPVNPHGLSGLAVLGLSGLVVLAYLGEFAAFVLALMELVHAPSSRTGRNIAVALLSFTYLAAGVVFVVRGGLES